MTDYGWDHHIQPQGCKLTLARTPEASISCPGRAKVRKPPALTASVANVHMRPACMQCTRPIYTLTDLGQLIRPGDGPSRAHCGDSCKQSIQAGT